MSNKYYFLTDFINREQFMQLRNKFEKHRESSGRIPDRWCPGELEKYAFDCGIITTDQYRKISETTLM